MTKSSAFTSELLSASTFRTHQSSTGRWTALSSGRSSRRFGSRLAAAATLCAVALSASLATASETSPDTLSDTSPETSSAEESSQPAKADSAAAKEPVAVGPRKEWKGLSFGIPSGGGPTVGGTYFLEDDIALKLDIGLDIGKTVAAPPAGGFDLGGAASAASDDLLVGLSVEAGIRFYLMRTGKLAPFAQPGLFVARPVMPGDFMAPVVLQANAGIGAEYFFNDNVSVAGLTGLGLRFANEFETIKLTTGTSALFLNLYW